MGESSLTGAIQTVIDVAMESFNTCLPGTFETYNFSSQKASVQPMLTKKYADGVVQTFKPIAEVPVMFPRTKNSGITFPISRGDGCLILFTQRSMELYLNSGKISNPGDPRKFDLSDAVAIPGLFTFNQENLASNNDDLELHHNGIKITIKKNKDIEIGTNQKITIKSNGDIELGTSSLLKLVNSTFLTIFDTHTHLYNPGPGAPVVTATPLPVSTSGNLTSKVSAE